MGKRVDAVSTDLIDRRLIENELLNFLGVGIHLKETFFEAENIPTQFTLYTRHSVFFSNRIDATWMHRWRGEVESNFSPAIGSKDVELYVSGIAGPQPIPGFEAKGRVWDYLWDVDPASDVAAMLGVGGKVILPAANHLAASLGFYGGYIGAQISVQASYAVSISAQTYGIETSSSFQTQELRFYGAGIRLLL